MAKKYSVNWENDEVVSVEVDGVQYADPDQIPDSEDRAQVLRLIAGATGADADEDFDKAFNSEFDEETKEAFRQLERDSARFPRVIVGLFLFIALLTLGIAAALTASTVAALSRETSAPGRVVDLVARRDADRQVFYFPVVEFYLPDESRQTVQLSEGSSTPGYTRNQAVTIRYDPDRPASTARIDSVGSTALMWIGPAITGTVGAGFLAATLFAAWFLRPTASSPPPA